MEKDIKLLIVPDVHGRDFWRGPVMENLDKEIVFLGDYVDPYPEDNITYGRAIEVLDEIINLRNEYDNITLLLGNHDAGYALDSYVCSARRNWRHYDVISDRFRDNIGLFDIAKEKKIGGKNFLFTHAGVHFNSWIKFNTYIFKQGFRATAKNFNGMLHSEDPEIRHGFTVALGDYSYYRGGMESYGSMIWADLFEFFNSKDLNSTKRIQVVGHTRLKPGKAINLRDKFYCLDCQCVFYIDSLGTIRYYDDDSEVYCTKQDNEGL